MTFPRISAAICVFAFIAVVSLAFIYLVNSVGPTLVHGTQVEHVAGVPLAGSTAANLVIKTASGDMHFTCAQHCVMQLGHIQRHIVEKANTDVYFIREADNTLVAIDAD